MEVYHQFYDDNYLFSLYAHLATTTVATTSDAVVRSQSLAFVDSTGSCSEGPHLHFGVADGSWAYGPDHRIDPYGWWATTTYPWDYNLGYLWTTDPPSFDLAKETSSNITTDTTWRGNYVVNGSISVNTGATLIIEPGTVVKFKTSSSGITVNGTLIAEGEADSKIYLTSYKDDTVGGDTNGDATATSPASEDWREIEVGLTGSTTFSHAVVRYGGYSSYPVYHYANIYNNGGSLTILNSQIATTTYYGVYNKSGTTTIGYSEINDNTYGLYLENGVANVFNSIIHDNSTYGVTASNSGKLILTDNTFSDNGTAVRAYNAVDFTHSGNLASGAGKGGINMIGDVDADEIWTKDDMPYIVSTAFSVNSGKTLTVDPGVVIKFDPGASILVNGELGASGTSTAKIYFTSIKDDTIGGDTNGDATSTYPAAGNWNTIKFTSTASSTLNHVFVAYGGQTWPANANIYNSGGNLTILNSQVATATSYALFSDAGTTTASYVELNNNNVGLYLEGGTVNISNSNFHNNSTYGVRTGTAGTLNLTDNTFANNTDASGSIAGNTIFSHSGNSDTTSGIRGFYMTGSLNHDDIWTEDGIPYVINSDFSVSSGNKLTINEGAIIKFAYGAKFTVDGELEAMGTTSDKIYFTSVKDDSVGGDTNGDGSATSPGSGDWNEIVISSTGKATFSDTVVRYGGYYIFYSNYTNIYNNGGDLTIINSQIATSTCYGVFNQTGTTTVSNSEINNNSVGLYYAGGTGSISYSSIHNNSSWGMYNGIGSSINAENNFWGISGGPNDDANRNPGADKVSSNVDYDPWLDSWPE